MTAIPRFYTSATPTRDHMPIVGIDHEFMRFLRLRKVNPRASHRAHTSTATTDEAGLATGDAA